MADIPNKQNTGDVTLYDELGNMVAIIQDGNIFRLAIDSVNGNTKQRHTETVQEGEFSSTARNKIDYTVPVGKVLYIEHMVTSAPEGDKLELGWQADGVTFFEQSVDKDAQTFAQTLLPQYNPYGPFGAGVEIRCRRITGNAGDQWSASMVGYLEDA